MNKTTLEILVEGRALLARPYGWIKHRLTKRRKGMDCYCSLGALRQVAYGHPFGFAKKNSDNSGRKALFLLEQFAGNGGMVTFNDHSTKKQVLKVWDQAITQAQQEETTPPHDPS